MALLLCRGMFSSEALWRHAIPHETWLAFRLARRQVTSGGRYVCKLKDGSIIGEARYICTTRPPEAQKFSQRGIKEVLFDSFGGATFRRKLDHLHGRWPV